jgi:ankyrin repeat protein
MFKSNPDQMRGDSKDIFLKACFANDYAAVKKLLESDKSLIQLVNAKGRNPLHLSVMGKATQEQLGVIKFLINEGVSLDHKTKYNNNLLHLIVGKLEPNLEIVKYLLELNDKFKYKWLIEHDLHGDLPLHRAAQWGNIAVIKMLLEYGGKIGNFINAKNISFKEWGNSTPFLYAAEYANWQVLQLLIERSVDVNVTDFTGKGALHRLILRTNLEKNITQKNIKKSIDILLKSGISLQIKYPNKQLEQIYLLKEYTAIDLLIIFNRAELLKYMASKLHTTVACLTYNFVKKKLSFIEQKHQQILKKYKKHNDWLQEPWDVDDYQVRGNIIREMRLQTKKLYDLKEIMYALSEQVKKAKKRIKEDIPYLQNTAILEATKLFKNVKNSIIVNPLPTAYIFRQFIANKGRWVPRGAITLRDIANVVRLVTGKKPRNLEFIAIGICSDGNHVITTNYHAPVIYRLYDLMCDNKHYKNIEKQRKKFRKQNNKLKFGNPKIHAETFIASLTKHLPIINILTIDAKGILNRNCIFCANYLHGRGLKSEPHYEKINNYNKPTKDQILVAVAWFKSLPVVTNIIYRPIDERYILNKIALQHQYSLETTTIQNVIGNYPYDLKKSDCNEETYVYAKALSVPIKNIFDRVKNRNGIRKITHFNNDEIKLKIDGRIKRSDKDKNKLSPVSPKSPRSKELVKFLHDWLKQGDKSSITFSPSNITLLRKGIKK